MSWFPGLYAASPPPPVGGPTDSSLIAPIFELGVDQATYPPSGRIEFDRTNISTDTWRVQVSTDLAFTSPMIDVTGLIGTGAIAITGLSAISSGKHFMRSRIERGTSVGPWSTIIVHGDAVSPTITSGNSTSLVENLTLAFPLTSNKPGEVVWSVFGGADSAQFEIATTNILRFVGNRTQDYELPNDSDGDNTYSVSVRATDLAGNFALKDMTVVVLNDPTDDPRNTTWSTRNGTNKNAFAAVSGTPPLSIVGSPAPGAAMLVRAKRAASLTKFQLETTITSLRGGDRFHFGLDDGSTDFSGYAIPGQSDTTGITFTVTDTETYYWYNGIKSFLGGLTTPMVVGDVFSITADTVAGTIKLYRTRGASTVQIGTTATITPWASFFAIAGTNGVIAQTSNFGLTPFARALDSGYDAY